MKIDDRSYYTYKSGVVQLERNLVNKENKVYNLKNELDDLLASLKRDREYLKEVKANIYVYENNNK